jgi:hypothetical protein
MALTFDVPRTDDVPLPAAYVRCGPVLWDKDYDFNARLQADLDELLDRIEAIEQDEELTAEQKAGQLAPLTAKRDNRQARLAAHPSGAVFVVIKLEVRKEAGSKRVHQVPEFDVRKFREVRLIDNGTKVEWRNDPDAAPQSVAITSADLRAIAYGMLKLEPSIAACEPEDA